MGVAPYRVHKLIQDLMKNPEAAAEFSADPKPCFARYGLAKEEVFLLEEGSMEAMTKLGVHPNLQMKYLRLRKPAGASVKLVGAGPLDAYLPQLLET